MLRTMDDFIRIGTATPHDAPVGLTDREVLNLEKLTGRKVYGGTRLLGRRVVRIPWDWERNW